MASQEPKTTSQKPKMITPDQKPEEPKTTSQEPKMTTPDQKPEEPKTTFQEPKVTSPDQKPEEPKTTSQEPKMTSPDQKPEEPTTIPLILPAKYSNRVVLKSILERSDGGVGLVGEKVVIGGWVQSKERKKEPEFQPAAAEVSDGVAVSPGHKYVRCMEILQTLVPLFRSVAKIFGGSSSCPPRAKLEPVTSKSTVTSLTPPPPIINLLVSDGSSVASLQVAIELSEAFPVGRLPIGTCILAEGVLNQISAQGKQKVELKVDKILQIGTVEKDKYPLSRKRLPLESLRECSHFRPRTTKVAFVMRIRSALTFGTDTFFQNNGFLSVQMPIITTTDAEGFSEKFRVTTLSEKEIVKKEQIIALRLSLEAVKASINDKNNLIQQFKRSDSNRDALLAAEEDLLKTSQLASQLEAKSETSIPEDFFSLQTYLTVSGRLHLESYACALGNVYSFGPRFRADRRETAKQLPEMWMVEAEMAFSKLEDAMNCAEDYFKFMCKWVLENCSEDMKFVAKRIDKNRINLLKAMISCQYVRITYMEAVNVLKKVAVAERKFEIQPEWGIALTAQHLSYLADEIYTKKPVIIYNFPKELKPFYVRLNDDGKTVAAFEIVIPKGGGTFITGNQNEERFDMLNTRINEVGLVREQYEWYLDLRRHGSVMHSGFSAGFDVMALFASGIADVRDAIPFPRSSGTVSN